MATTLFSGTAPGTSTASGTGVPGDIMFTAIGTPGFGVAEIQLSNDAGTNWISTGARFDNNDMTPKIVTFVTGQTYRIKASGKDFDLTIERA